MTTTLRVIVDEVVNPTTSGAGRYSEELTRALIGTAPPGCVVSGVVAAVPDADIDRLRELLPGLTDLFRGPLARRELQRAWQHGITKLPGTGMVHSPGLLAPLFRHDRDRDPSTQTVVTLPDAMAWTDPGLLDPRDVGWIKAVARRAVRFADAVVVPTHSIAAEISDHLNLGDRVRVIGGGVSPRVRVPMDADARAARMSLPNAFLLHVGTLAAHRGIDALIRSLNSTADAGLPLLLVGRDGWRADEIHALVSELPVGRRVRFLGALDDADLSVVMDRATVFVFPALAGGFALSMLEAFHLGTPVVHSDAPAVAELSAGAGVTALREDPVDYPERLAEAISSVVSSPETAERLAYSGRDRAAVFGWRDSAERVWQLHAEL